MLSSSRSCHSLDQHSYHFQWWRHSPDCRASLRMQRSPWQPDIIVLSRLSHRSATSCERASSRQRRPQELRRRHGHSPFAPVRPWGLPTPPRGASRCQSCCRTPSAQGPSLLTHFRKSSTSSPSCYSPPTSSSISSSPHTIFHLTIRLYRAMDSATLSTSRMHRHVIRWVCASRVRLLVVLADWCADVSVVAGAVVVSELSHTESCLLRSAMFAMSHIVGTRHWDHDVRSCPPVGYALTPWHRLKIYDSRLRVPTRSSHPQDTVATPASTRNMSADGTSRVNTSFVADSKFPCELRWEGSWPCAPANLSNTVSQRSPISPEFSRSYTVRCFSRSDDSGQTAKSSRLRS